MSGESETLEEQDVGSAEVLGQSGVELDDDEDEVTGVLSIAELQGGEESRKDESNGSESDNHEGEDRPEEDRRRQPWTCKLKGR